MRVRASYAHLLSWSMAMEESGVALIRYALDLRHEGSVPNSAKLNRLLGDMVRGWVPAVESGLAEIGERRSAALAARYADAFPAGYRAGAGPDEAALDILQLHSLEIGRAHV